MKRWFKWGGYFALFLLLVISGCEKDEPAEEVPIEERELTSNDVQSILSQWYLWNREMPDVAPDETITPQKMLDTLRNKSLDRWSYISTSEEYEQYYQAGQYIGHGFSYMLDEEENLRVAFVFKDSPLYTVGIKRGWKITHINGTAINSTVNPDALIGPDEEGITNEISFQDLSGQSFTYQFEKKAITMNTVLAYNIIESDTSRIGYFAFKSFIGPSIEELNGLFRYFSDHGVNELIVDLRYNGGGRSDVSLLLGALIGGDRTDEKVLSRYVHNEDRSDNDFDLVMQKQPYSLNLSRVFFIGSRGTASASEAVINGLEPFMDVYMVGEDTYGKPVGMYVWKFKDYTIIPVSFKIANANGYGDYYDGLAADAYAADDLDHELGDPEEARLKEALYFIENGSFSPESRVKKLIIKKKQPWSLQFEIGAY